MTWAFGQGKAEMAIWGGAVDRANSLLPLLHDMFHSGRPVVGGVSGLDFKRQYKRGRVAISVPPHGPKPY